MRYACYPAMEVYARAAWVYELSEYLASGPSIISKLVMRTKDEQSVNFRCYLCRFNDSFFS